MSMQSRLARASLGMHPRGETTGEGVGRIRPERLIPILLALYLTPALLVVLLVGGVGMLVLAVARSITTLVHGPEAWPRRSAGRESSVL